MSSSLATAFITLVPKCDTTSLKKEGETAGQNFGNSFSTKLSTAAKVGAAAMATTIAGVGLAAGAVKNAAQATADYGDNVDKMSQKIGFSAQAYQEWAYVMERAGTSVDILQSGMKTLSTQAQAGAEEFQKLGISEEEVANLSKEDLFGKVIDGLSKMEDGTERTALSTKLLGKSATELAPLLNEGTDAINEQREMAEKYGLVMSDKAVKASAEFNDSLTTLNGAVTGAKNALLGELLPSCTQVADGLTLLITGNVDQGIELIGTGIQTMLDNITANLPEFLDRGLQIVDSMLEGLINNLPAIINGMTQLLTKVISHIPTFAPRILSAAVTLFMAIVQSIPQVLGSLLSALGSMISQGVSTVRGFVGQMTSAGYSLIQGIVAGLSPSAVIEKIRSICSSAVDQIKSFFGIHSPSRLMRELFGYVGDGMVLGLEDSQKDVTAAMDSLMDSTYAVADGYTANVMVSRGGSSAPNVVEAIETLHNDLYSIIKDATPDGITGRQFGRLVHKYA